LLRREVLKTYKQLIKSVRLIEDEGYKRELTSWVRTDFKFNKELKDEVIFHILTIYLNKLGKFFKIAANRLLQIFQEFKTVIYRNIPYLLLWKYPIFYFYYAIYLEFHLQELTTGYLLQIVP